MTGWYGPDISGTFLSNITIMSLQDIGFVVQGLPTPEPPAAALLLAAVLLLRRRR